MSLAVPYHDTKLFSFKETFFTLLDNLVSHKSSSRLETILLIIIFYFQILSGFFDEKVGVFLNSKVPDNYFITANRIVRLQKLFTNSLRNYSMIIYILFSYELIMILAFVLRIYMLSKDLKEIYSFYDVLLNFSLKIYYFIFFQPSLDIIFGLICFGDKHPLIADTTCSIADKIPALIVMLLLLVMTIALGFLISIYYNDTMLLSQGFFARLSSKYELYLMMHLILFCLILNFIDLVGSLLFIIYNLCLSFFFLKYYYSLNPFYDNITNKIIGLFHWLYFWTSIFCLLFTILPLEQVSILYILVALAFAYMHDNLSNASNEKVSLVLPFTKLRTAQSAQVFIKILTNMINSLEINPEEKAKVIGIINIHSAECPSHMCPLKEEGLPLYFPQTDEWSVIRTKRTNRKIDRIYLSFFVCFIFEYYIEQKIVSPDLLMNYSLYYLIIIGNNNLAMYYCQKAKRDSTLKLEEEFMHFRTRRLISQTIAKPLKPSDEPAATFEEVDTTMFFKYQNLSDAFLNEIINDTAFSLDFWHLFIDNKGNKKKLDYNKIFNLAAKLQKAKKNVDDLWKELFSTYNAYNEFFELFEQYTEYMSDDEAVLTNLHKIRDKNFQNKGILNHYNFLFNNETGIIIANGDKNKEGLIEKASSNISSFFLYSTEELKGMNVSSLMPKIFEKDHQSYMKRYVNIGEKKIMDKMILGFGKDKLNFIFPLNLTIKLFPLLCENIYFCGLFNRESFDDIILLDKNFMIQGMSQKLLHKFTLEPLLFQTCDVPFWLISKDFLHHYQTFMMNNSKFNENKELFNAKRIQRAISKVAEYEYEISENTELEWQIVIPPLLLTYAVIYEDDQIESSVDVTNQFEDSNINDMYLNSAREQGEGDNMDNSFDVSVNEEDEEANLMITEEDESFNTRNIPIGDFNKQISNDIERYMSIFTSSDSNNLITLGNIIDKINEGNDFTFHFVISFKQITFGEGNYGFVIRCIEKQDDNSKSSISDHGNKKEEDDDMKINTRNNEGKGDHGNNNNINNEPKKMFNRRKYLSGLRDLTETTNDELPMYENNYEINRFTTDRIKDAIVNYREEILSVSKIFGEEQLATIDENHSLASNVSQKAASISKHTKIQEIKNNLMNGGNHIILALIKLLFFIICALSILFVVIYVINTTTYFEELLQLDTFHGNITQFTSYYVGIVSLIISLKSFNVIYNKEDEGKYNINFYTGDNKETYINKTYELIDLLILQMMEKEMQLESFQLNSLNESFPVLWTQVPLAFPFTDVYGDSSLVVNLCLILYQAHQLVGTPEFNLRNPIKDKLIQAKMDYLYGRIINYSYVVNLATMLKTSNDTKNVAIEENKADISLLQYLLIGYFTIIISLLCIYGVLLYFTNRALENAIILISKISSSFIQDIIKGITYFKQSSLNKFTFKTAAHKPMTILNEKHIEKDNEKKTDGNTAGKDTPKDEKKDKKDKKSKDKGKDKEKEKEKEDNEGGGALFDEHHHVKLTLLHFAYYQIIIALMSCFAFFIPFYLRLIEIVTETNALFSVREYMYSDVFRLGFLFLNTKRMITEGDKVPIFPYSRTFTIADKEYIIKHINRFQELSMFYEKTSQKGICDFLTKNLPSGYTDCANYDLIEGDTNLSQLLEMFDNLLFSIDQSIKINHQIMVASQGHSPQHLMQLSSPTYKLCELIYNSYLIHFHIIIEEAFSKSLITFNSEQEQTLFILNVIFSVLIILFSLYVISFLINSLVKMIILSRFIIRLVPTRVIDKAKDLEEWIENKLI